MIKETKKNKIETKKKIMEAAYKEFAERGFDGARMQKIAERAKINKAMLHYYFKDKETLYETVMEYFHNLFDQIIAEKNVDAKDRITFLRQTVNAYYEIFFEYPEFKKIFIQEIASGLKTMKKIFLKQNPKEIKNIMEKFFLLNKIRELQKSQEIRNDIEEEHVMLSIIGLIESTLMQTTIAKQILDFNEKELNEFIEKRKNTIIKILDKGLAPS
jgi:AcrR family transcriptional regulator